MTPQEIDQAACGPIAKEVFFDDLDEPQRGTKQYKAALSEARKHCDGCPIRKSCFVGQVKVPYGFAGGYTQQARRFLRLGEPRWRGH